ncbi:giguanylate cyclase [Ochrobactrum sp. POC9]|nr:giguanylate cyclase [Ochrobactrum sp. POC9]
MPGCGDDRQDELSEREKRTANSRPFLFYKAFTRPRLTIMCEQETAYRVE